MAATASQEIQNTIKQVMAGKQPPYVQRDAVLQDGDIVTIDPAKNKFFEVAYSDNDAAHEHPFVQVIVDIKRGSENLEAKVSLGTLMASVRTDTPRGVNPRTATPALYAGAKLAPRFKSVYDALAALGADAFHALLGWTLDAVTFTVHEAQCTVQEFLSADDRAKSPEDLLREKTAKGKWAYGLYILKDVVGEF